ncbi:unnamed protein product [Cylicocyclus nassatus]|uniref:Uncharacterized protein n=1 Tax=Cylicocyclus nassatus TaxID=53992 RepID=A0AA36M546_CYLNA|nr:unnamed protein product [Cylicocyclus nassatus]
MPQSTSESGSGVGVTTSVVESHQYQADPNTTVTHTTITYTNEESVPSGSAEPKYGSKDRTAKNRPKMVVPNASVPVLSPLFLRCNPIQRAICAKVSGTHLSTPKEKVVYWKAEMGYSARYLLAPTAETPVQCTFTMPALLARVATIQHIINTPILNVSAFCLPPKQRVKKQKIIRKTACAHLMLPPQGPLHAEVLKPLWETLVFTIAYGKHLAVEYRIPKITPLKVVLIKCEKHKVKEVDARTLYKKVKKQDIEVWKANEPHQIVLTTVERSDPQMIKRIRLEQNPLFDRMPPCCDVAEVDYLTTEQTTYKTKTNTGETTQEEKHTYVDHQLIQRWENTVHMENRRRQID